MSQTCKLAKMSDINAAYDDCAIKEFENDLRDMSDEKIERELNAAQDQIDELEPWVEALCAMQRRRAKATTP